MPVCLRIPLTPSFTPRGVYDIGAWFGIGVFFLSSLDTTTLVPSLRWVIDILEDRLWSENSIGSTTTSVHMLFDAKVEGDPPAGLTKLTTRFPLTCLDAVDGELEPEMDCVHGGRLDEDAAGLLVPLIAVVPDWSRYRLKEIIHV